MIDAGAFRDDQAHPMLRTSAIVRRDLRSGDAARRLAPRHWGHDDSIRQRDVSNSKRREQRIHDRQARLVAEGHCQRIWRGRGFMVANYTGAAGPDRPTLSAMGPAIPDSAVERP